MVNIKDCALVISPYCSNNCIFCRPLGANSRLSPEKLKEAEDNLYKNIDYFKNGGYTSVDISGGDPLEYRGLAALVRRLKKEGFKAIGISTNGVALHDAGFCRRLIENGMNKFRIPLYGSCASVHDAVTRAKGSFAATVQGIKNIRKNSKKTKIVLSCLLLKQNVRDLTGVFDLMHKLNCDQAYFSSAFVTNEEFRKFYIPLRSQGPFYRHLILHARKAKKPVFFWEVPFCLIGFDNDFTSNSRIPAHLGKFYELPEKVRTDIADIPSYRKKVKVAMCSRCAVYFKCDGFYVNDITRYGLGNLKPIETNMEDGLA